MINGIKNCREKMAEKQTFKTVLEKRGRSDATCVTIPFDVEKVFGAKRVPVRISINDAEYRSTVVRMDGKYMLAIPKAFREAAGVKAGELIEVALERDTAERTVEVPEDLARELEKNSLTEAFSRLSYTHRKERVRAIEEAKKEETRKRRIDKTIEMLKKTKD